MGKREEIVSALTDDGDQYRDSDGRVWTLTMPADECSSLMDEQGDGMWCGRLEWATRSSLTGYDVRPAGMNGRARKIGPNQGHDAVWWQPPSDVAEEHLRTMAATIDDILSYGYCGLMVETDDGYSASLWGIEPFPNAAMVRATVEDLVIDVQEEITRAAIARARETFTLLDAVR